MRELTDSEKILVVGGTSIYDHRALSPSHPIGGPYPDGMFHPLDTGNAVVNLVNAFALVGTGELSQAQFLSMYPDLWEDVGVAQLPSGNFVVDGRVVGATDFENGNFWTTPGDNVNWLGVAADLAAITIASVGGAFSSPWLIVGGSGAGALQDVAEIRP